MGLLNKTTSAAGAFESDDDTTAVQQTVATEAVAAEPVAEKAVAEIGRAHV